ncbi:MAG: Replication factor C large subunit [Nitrosopumilales archaeon]|nr:MAG: Replication factor C large subunit [Nitrosopumilales archaeon]
MMWSEKYRPQSIADMVGNEEARTAFVEWFAKWKKGTKPLLLVGPPGIGKTTLANLASKQFGYDMIGLNASDIRNKQRIQEMLSPVLSNLSIFGKQMIFVDEVDGIHGRSDFGGVEGLIKILKEPTVPIILAANSETSDKMKGIKKVVKTIHLKPLPPRLLQLYLQKILKNENAKLGLGSIIKIIINSRGDLRSMINSSQVLVTGFEPSTERSFERLNVEDGINAFFKANSKDEARIVLYSLRIDPREKINAFYSSVITSNISQIEMEKMLQVLSEADLLYGRIMKTQEWRLLRYLDNILLKLYQKDISIRYTKYNLSWPLLNRLRWDGRSIKSLANVFAKKMHISKSTFATFYFPFILFCMKNKKLELEIDDTLTELLEKEMKLLK